MSTQVVVLEQLTLTAPLGVRFWDVATVSPAESGLLVLAYPDAFPELRTTAVEGRSGVYSFSDLPNLREAENGAGDDAFWSANPPIVPYTVQVYDPRERYLPFRFSTLLPVRGLFGFWSGPLFAALTPDPTWLPIFSIPSRPMPSSSASIRAQLQDDSTPSRPLPASWAILTVQAPGLPLVTGLADKRGMVSISQPYPEPVDQGATSPLSAAKLTDQSWPVEVEVFYNSGKADQPLPDLQEVIQQSVAIVWRDTAHTAPADRFTLKFGSDLVLRSLDSTSGRELSVLLVTPAGSPL
jgi:hypothetical protein